MSDEAIEIETVEEEYKITGEGCEVTQRYDFSDYQQETENEIKELIEGQLKDTIGNLKKIYSTEIDSEIAWTEENDFKAIKVVLSTDKPVALDFVSSTATSSFIHESPRYAYRMLLENKQWIERYQTPKISDLMNSREHNRG